MTTIMAAAIRLNDTVYTVPRPGRHHDVIRVMVMEHRVDPSRGEQGFLTVDHRFVDRVEARQIAVAAGQCVKTVHSTKLFSEDVW